MTHQHLSIEEITALLWQDLAKAYAERSIQLLRAARDRAEEPKPRAEDEYPLLKAPVAARMLGISVGHLYRTADRYPFTVRLSASSRSVGFSRQGLLDFLHRAGARPVDRAGTSARVVPDQSA